MDIIRNDDGTLVVPVAAPRSHHTDDDTGAEDMVEPEALATTRVLHPGEGGYDEALADWDEQQNPERGEVISTASGREEAMHLIHEVAESPTHAIEPAVEHLEDPEAAGQALRHVLVGGVHSVEAFADEVAAAEGGDVLPAHQTTKIIGEVLAELD